VPATWFYTPGGRRLGASLLGRNEGGLPGIHTFLLQQIFVETNGGAYLGAPLVNAVSSALG
jgi:hypothetical protein